MPFPTDLDRVTREDMERLVSQQEREGLHLDYKQDLPASDPGSKFEFLADCISFANSHGGTIVFGVTERRDPETGNTDLPEAIPGVPVNTIGPAMRMMEDWLRTLVEPALRYTTRVIDIDADHAVLLWHIPRSGSRPHAFRNNKALGFYARRSTGKYPLALPEVRSAFAQSQGQVEGIRLFLLERLADICADRTPGPLAFPQRIVLHVVSASVADPGFMPNLTNAYNDLAVACRPILAGGFNPTHNLEGYLCMIPIHVPNAQGLFTYSQLFRRGAVETVGCLPFNENFGKTVDGREIEQWVLDVLGGYLWACRRLGAESPLAIRVALLGFKDYALLHPNRMFPGRFDRDIVELPPVVIDTYPNLPEEPARDRKLPATPELVAMMRPIFTVMWQATGAPGHPG